MALVLAVFSLFGLPAKVIGATQPTINSNVGDTVSDPITGHDVTVTEVFKDGNLTWAVYTSEGRIIYTRFWVGDIYPADDGGANWTIVQGGGPPDYPRIVSSFKLERGTGDNKETKTLQISYSEDYSPSSGGDDGSNANVTPPMGNSGYIVQGGKAASGKNGRNGGGIKIFGVTIGVSSKPGGNGSPGPTVNVNAGTGTITTITNLLPGITAISIGGDGGKGGDGYIGVPASNGGNAGAGGAVTVVSQKNISTSGADAYGIIAQSEAGRAGNGGSAYEAAGRAGDAGASASGGPVSVTNYGAINTSGTYAHGLVAKSLGGNAGKGGSGYGIVGGGGSSQIGGKGGSVQAYNYGSMAVLAGVLWEPAAPVLRAAMGVRLPLVRMAVLRLRLPVRLHMAFLRSR